MSLNLFDRVKETCSAPGTGTVTLLGAVTGFQSFAIIGNANTCYYTIADQYGANWEVGIGTYTLSGTTLARTTVLSSSAGGTTKANFATGIQDVFVTYPAEKAVYVDATSNVNLGTNALINVSHIGINTTTTPTIALRAVGDNTVLSRIAMRGYSSDANSSAIRVTKFRGTESAPQAPLSGDSLGKFELAGYGTTSSDGYPQASFEGVATENWGATARGSKTVFKVTPNTTTTQVIAFTLDQDKSASFAGALSVTGHTTFEGVTSTGATGTGKLVYDTSPTLTTPIFTTNITSPLVIGGTTASSTLILESTSGTGTTDYISFRTASQSERFRVGNAGQWGIGGATYGTAGQAFLSGGASAAPTWGTLGVNGGGTGLTTLATGFIPSGNGTSAFSSGGLYTNSGATASNPTALTWFTNQLALQVGTSSSLVNSAGIRTYLQNNLYANAAGNYTYISTNAGQALQLDESGNYLFYTAPSGTAGTTATLTKQLHLALNGNLGLGTTTFSVTNKEFAINAASGVAGITFGVAGVLTGYLYSGAGSTFLSTSGAYPLLLGTADTEAMRIHASRGVSIGNNTDPGAGNLRFNTTGSKGIYFGSSSQLNDYEEGTYAPTITCSTSGTITLLAGYTNLNYTKVGRLVSVTGFLYVSSVSSPVGYINITTPFTPGGTNKYSELSILISGSTVNCNVFVARQDSGGPINIFRGDVNSFAQTSANTIQANTEFYISLTYQST